MDEVQQYTIQSEENEETQEEKDKWDNFSHSSLVTPRTLPVSTAQRKNAECCSSDKDDQLLKLINSDKKLPEYVKIILAVLKDTRDQLLAVNEWSSKLSEENEKLRKENAELKKLLESRESQSNSRELPTTSLPRNSDSKPVENELERSRSIVISGIPEFSSTSSADRAYRDLNAVNTILNHLDVQCIPVTVYRLGKHENTRSRFVKTLESAGTEEFTGTEKEARTELDSKAWERFNNTVQRLPDGYYVRLPWIEQHPYLPGNKALAYRR
uniref:UBX domain-containing protein 6 n=1 Tax=Haemonchus contortus TaxID=6289 RepID=A0A7I4YBW2_HAECO